MTGKQIMISNISNDPDALLLDTHILIWYVEGDSHLTKQQIEILEKARRQNKLYISAISIWEITMLSEKERIVLSVTLSEWIDKALSIEGLNIIDLSADILIESCQLPHYLHKDPADRMIIATARHLRISLMTFDNKMIEYADKGYLTITQ